MKKFTKPQMIQAYKVWIADNLERIRASTENLSKKLSNNDWDAALVNRII